MLVDIDTLFQRKIPSDKAFIVSEVSSVTSGSTTNLHLKNPPGTQTELWLSDISIMSDGSYKAFVHDGFSSVPTGGTTLSIESLLLDTEGSNNDGVATSSKNVTFTADSTHAVGVSGGGASGTSIGGHASHPTMVLEPDREVVVEVENTSSSENNYSISVTYVEVAHEQ